MRLCCGAAVLQVEARAWAVPVADATRAGLRRRQPPSQARRRRRDRPLLFARPGAGTFCTNAGCDQCHLQRGAAGRRRRCAGSLASAAKMAAPQTALYGTRATAAAAIVAMSMAAPTPAPGLPSMRWSCRTSLPLGVKGTKLVAAMSASRRKRARARLRSRARDRSGGLASRIAGRRLRSCRRARHCSVGVRNPPGNGSSVTSSDFKFWRFG